jgi:hypothetical protein
MACYIVLSFHLSVYHLNLADLVFIEFPALYILMEKYNNFNKGTEYMILVSSYHGMNMSGTMT